MILETAKISVAQEQHAEFQDALRLAVENVLAKATGFIKFQLHTGIEEPNIFLLHIHWETLEDHTVGFRESELFVKWRKLIGPYFAAAPEVTHWKVS